MFSWLTVRCFTSDNEQNLNVTCSIADISHFGFACFGNVQKQDTFPL